MNDEGISPASLEDHPRPYNVDRWGEGHFRVGADGRLYVRPVPDEAPEAALEDVLAACRAQGLRQPVLVRFAGILRHRVRVLTDAFADAIAEQDYAGGYTVVYPVKVNQQRRVVHEMLRAHTGRGRVGLEAGSKPELLTVMALSGEPDDVIICNGYKDSAYIRLALMAQKLGFRVTLVVEKLSELPVILNEARRLDVAPRIGLRVRLLSIGEGNWQNTGGEKSKFGLSAPRMMEAVEICRAAGRLDAIRMLHFHLGSQVANIRDIKAGMNEAARYYQELRQLRVPVQEVDVGGGLGVDYEGTRSRSWCSMNYTPGDYARQIVRSLRERCRQHDLPEPDIISESGRALTAHHAVLLTNIIDRETLRPEELEAPGQRGVPELTRLWQLYQQLGRAAVSPLEQYQELLASWQDLQDRFLQDEINLDQRAWAERVYINAQLRLRARLDPAQRLQRELLDTLNEKLADKLFVNFSIFQSLPDVWGIDQIFPVTPLRGLEKTPDARAVVQDITCDSDGRMDRYADGDGVEATLPLPAAEDSELAFFMVGGYQEILGDMHNLFGDTDSVDAEITAEGEIRLDHAIDGDTVSTVLRYVNFDPERLLATLEQHCERAHLDEQERATVLAEIRAGLNSYTYLE
jgi:arginine decarboxylase